MPIIQLLSMSDMRRDVMYTQSVKTLMGIALLLAGMGAAIFGLMGYRALLRYYEIQVQKIADQLSLSTRGAAT